MLLLIQYTLIFSSVLVLVALGGCVSEHSGVINLGLEGIMVIGALGGALMMRYLGTSSAFVMVLLVMLAAILFGMIYSSQISDLISSVIIYLCGFVLFIKITMNNILRKSEEKKARALKASEGGDK